MKQEKRGIYNVTFNEKKATPIHLKVDYVEELIKDTIKEAVVMYVEGAEDYRRKKGFGATHIKLHLEKGSEGEISLEELLNLGNSLREYLKVFKEPFVEIKDNRISDIFEWENDKGVRFRAVVGKIPEKNLKEFYQERWHQERGRQLPLSSPDDEIITFYSDRNLNKQMEFKNPKVTQYYQSLKNTKEAQEALRKKVKESALKIQKQSKDKELER